MRLNCKILYRKLLPSRPSHDRFRDLDALLIRECDGEREGFPCSHGQIAGKRPAGTGAIPHGALANGPALYETEQCTRKRWKGRIEKDMGASLGGPF